MGSNHIKYRFIYWLYLPWLSHEYPVIYHINDLFLLSSGASQAQVAGAMIILVPSRPYHGSDVHLHADRYGMIWIKTCSTLEHWDSGWRKVVTWTFNHRIFWGYPVVWQMYQSHAYVQIWHIYIYIMIMIISHQSSGTSTFLHTNTCICVYTYVVYVYMVYTCMYIYIYTFIYIYTYIDR